MVVELAEGVVSPVAWVEKAVVMAEGVEVVHEVDLPAVGGVAVEPVVGTDTSAGVLSKEVSSLRAQATRLPDRCKSIQGSRTVHSPHSLCEKPCKRLLDEVCSTVHIGNPSWGGFVCILVPTSRPLPHKVTRGAPVEVAGDSVVTVA